MEKEIITRACALLKEFEGFRSKIYYCSAGVKTIGYGFCMPEAPSDKTMTKEEAEIILQNKVTLLAQKLAKHCPALILFQMPAICYAVLLSFIYNVGFNAFYQSTLLKKILLLDTAPNIKEQFLRWNKAGGKVIKGLQNRREKESELFVQAYKPWKAEKFHLLNLGAL